MKRKAQVFVSSTFLDLKQERQAAVAAILESGNIPAGMELFAAGNQSQMEIIREWIDQSDVFMLILGGRYGSIDSESGLSYTELEFLYALETNTPVFSVVLSDKGVAMKMANGENDVQEKDNIEKYKSFKAEVNKRMVNYVDDEKDIKLAILRALPKLVEKYEISGWVSGQHLTSVGQILDITEENRLLREEIQTLKLKISEMNKNRSSKSKNIVFGSSTFSELVEILRGKTFKIDGHTTDVMTVLINNYHIFVNGVTNTSEGHGAILYNEAFPILITHGLADFDKLPASRRYKQVSLTKDGRAFLAHFQKLALETKSE